MKLIAEKKKQGSPSFFLFGVQECNTKFNCLVRKIFQSWKILYFFFKQKVTYKFWPFCFQAHLHLWCQDCVLLMTADNVTAVTLPCHINPLPQHIAARSCYLHPHVHLSAARHHISFHFLLSLFLLPARPSCTHKVSIYFFSTKLFNAAILINVTEFAICLANDCL